MSCCYWFACGKHLWRNRLTRSAVNRKVAGSSPARCKHFFSFSLSREIFFNELTSTPISLKFMYGVTFSFFQVQFILIHHRGLGRDVKPRGGGFCQKTHCRTHEATSGAQTLYSMCCLASFPGSPTVAPECGYVRRAWNKATLVPRPG